MNRKPDYVSSYQAKAEHFAELGSRAAYNAAVAVSAHDREAWEERAARYDETARLYVERARRAA